MPLLVLRMFPPLPLFDLVSLPGCLRGSYPEFVLETGLFPLYLPRGTPASLWAGVYARYVRMSRITGG